MKTIISCSDGSHYAESVYEHSAWAASRMGAAVHVLHMLDTYREKAEITDLSGALGLDRQDELLEELVSAEQTRKRVAILRGKAVLEEARRSLLAAGVERVEVVQHRGKLVEVVTRMEEELDADLLVIGKRGESADFAKLHLGSNLERVIRASLRPVLVSSREFRPIERVLVAYDGGPSAEKAIRYLIDEPLLRGLRCDLLRAGKIDADAEWFLHEAAGKLAAAGYEVGARVEAGHPEEVIAEAVRRDGISLLVMGAYGHSRVRQLMVGSITTAMVRTCLVPVLMFR